MTELVPQAAGIPLPQPGLASAPFWEGCAAGELRYQHCEPCQAPVMNPSTVCHRCGGRDLGWRVSGGRGRLYSWTVVWRPATPAFEVPYAPAIVDVDEGFQLVTSIVGCTPDDLAADLAVEVVFHEVGEGVVLPYFRPARGSAGPVRW